MPAGENKYTHGHHESVLRSHTWRTAANSAAYLLPHLGPGLSLLDVGCGPGTITRDFATLLAPGSVVGIDASAEAIDQARASLPEPEPAPGDETPPPGDEAAFDFGAGAGQPPPAAPEFEVADLIGYAEEAGGERFDVVHAHQVLQHVADPVQMLRAMGALAAPGGLVAARDGDYAAMTWYPLLPELDDWLRLYQAGARADGGEPNAGRRLLSWARAAGFTDVTTSASTWCFAPANDGGWWGEMWADRITESALARHLVDQSLATTDDLRRISAGWRRWAEDPDGWFAILHGEILCRRPRE